MSRVHTHVCTGAQHPLYLYPLFWASAAAVHCAKDALYRDAQTVVAESLALFGTGAVGVPVAEQHGSASKDAGKPVCVCVCVCVAGPPIRPHCIRGAEHHSSCRMRVWSSRPRPVWTSGTLAPGMPSNCLLDEALPCKDSETSISRVKRYPLIHDALCRCACRIRTTRLLMRDPRSGVEALGRRIWPDGNREHRLARGAPERLCQLRTP